MNGQSHINNVGMRVVMTSIQIKRAVAVLAMAVLPIVAVVAEGTTETTESVVETPVSSVELKQAVEVIDILKARFVDHDRLDDKLLNEASVAGILARLGHGAVVVDTGATGVVDPMANDEVAALARAEVIDPQIGYVRVSNVVAETPAALDVELKKFGAVQVQGFILDLRFADGNDYDAARAVAGRFLSDGQKLFGIKRAAGKLEVFQAKRSNDAVLRAKWQDEPLIILVNNRTRGSAEAVAGALRSQNRGVLIGQSTDGSAVDWAEVKLSDGRLLRVATAKLILPNVDDPETLAVDVFPGGVTPDIKVSVDVNVEREVVLGLDKALTLTASLEPSELKKGMTEADLVKAHRGEVIDAAPVTVKGEPPQQRARDVVLQRAVDVLKGIRVLLSWR